MRLQGIRLAALSRAAIFLVTGVALAATPGDLLRSVPLRFEPISQGNYKWTARNAAYAVAFEDKETLLAAGNRAMRIVFEGSRSGAPFEPADKLAVSTNYFRSDERRALPAYSRLRRTGVYPGIDVVYYGDGQDLEYDFEVAPGADPSQIGVRFIGADDIRLGANGDVVLKLGDNEIRQKLPLVYQRTADGVHSVRASYELDQRGTIRFKIGEYDASRPLVVDPSIVLTAYFPGSGADFCVAMAHDARGLLYMAGATYSDDFARVGESYNIFLRNGLREGWVMRLDPNATGDALIQYATFIGSSATDDIKAMTVDAAGIVYIAGNSDAFDYPTTDGAYVKTFTGGTKRVVVSVLDTTLGPGGLVYSTFFGGTSNDEPSDIAVRGGKIYITGFATSTDFPVFGAFQSAKNGGYDAFISVFDPSRSGNDSLVFSSYIGGITQDVARSIVVDDAGAAYIGGYTYSADFPTTAGSFRPFYSGLGDAFLAKIDVGGSQIAYATFLGGSNQDQAKKIVLQPDGRVGIVGFTLSDNFQITQNAIQPIHAGNGDVFFTILDLKAVQFSDALVYSTFFGGNDADVAYDLRRDASGKYYFCGYTMSADFPLRNPLEPVSKGGGVDAFAAIIDPVAPINNALIYSSYLTSNGLQVAYACDFTTDGRMLVSGYSTGALFAPGQAQPVIPTNTNIYLLAFLP